MDKLKNSNNPAIAKMLSQLQVMKGEPGKTPVKGVDYFTPEEIADILNTVQKKINTFERGLKGEKGDKGDKGEKGAQGNDGADGYSPVKGIDYFTPEEQAIMLKRVLTSIPKPKDGVSPDVKEIVDKVVKEVEKASDIGLRLTKAEQRLIRLGGGGISFLSQAGDVAIGSQTNGQVLAWNSTSNKWEATTVGGSGTVTNVATGTGLTGGPITGTGTISLDSKLAPADTLTGNALKYLRVNAGETAVEYATVTAGTGDVVGPASSTDNAITRFDSTTGKLIQNSTVTVADDGVIANVNAIQLDTTPSTITATQGQMYWDTTENTVSVNLDVTNGVTLSLGTEQYVRVVNKTGVQINDGQVVYISGAQGNRPTASLARADALSTSNLIGVATQNIADNAEGFVTTSGEVHGYNTTGFAAGDKLYVSASTAGLITNTAPASPNNVVVVGVALNSTVNGTILVKTHQSLAASSTLADNSDLVAPTQKAVKTYADTKIASTYLDTDTTLAANSDSKIATQKATKTYVDNMVAGLLDYRGAYNASGNTFPASGGSGTAGAIMKGDMWVISVAGTLGGTAVQIGDSLIANVDTPGQTAGNWNILNGNIAYVPEDVANKSTDGTFAANSTTLYPSQSAAKTYADTKALLAGSISQSFQVSQLEVGHATDTSITRVSAGVIAVEGATVPTLTSTSTFSTGIKTFLAGMFALRNVANTFNAFFTNTNTADRTYTLKDASGTLAFTSDITGTNSGTNTGDQTITNTSDATSHTVTLSASGGSVQLVEGSNITLTTTGTGSAGVVTIASTGGTGTVTASGGALTANSVVLGAGTTDTKVSTGITTDGVAQVNLGVNATTIGKVKMFGNTSGDVTIQPTAAAGTATVQTLPATTGTLVNRVTTANGVSATNTDGALSFTLGSLSTGTINGQTISSTANFTGTVVVTTSTQTPTIELGHATDTTLSRVSAGVVAVEGQTLAFASSVASKTSAFVYVIDGGGSAITTGSKGFLSIPAAYTITGWTLVADQTGSAVVDVKKSTYAGFPTTTSICAADLPTLSAVQKNQNLSAGTWTTAVSAGDMLEFVVNSAATVTRLTLTIVATKS